MIITSIFRTLESLKIGYLWKVLFLSALITIIIFTGLVTASIFAIGLSDYSGAGWIGSIVAWAGSGAAITLSWFLFPITLPLITYIFLDGIADTIETRCYPSRIGTPPSWFKTLPSDIKLVLVLVILNIIALPLYFVPVVNLFIYYLLNGYVLGREFFEMIALRHYSRKKARSLRRENLFRVMLAGVAITLCATTPILNIFAPVLATVFMVHVFHNTKKPG